MIDTFRGTIRARAWPKKRGRTLHPTIKEQNELFRQAQQFIKYLAPSQQAVAMEATKGTPLYPRDLLTMIVYGRAYYLTDQDGRTFYTMAQRQDVSESLDVLGSAIGSVLIRGPQYWEATPGSTIGGKSLSSLVTGSPSNQPAASAGAAFAPTEQLTLFGLQPTFDEQIDRSYRVQLATVTPTAVDQLVASTPEYVGLANQSRTRSFFFDEPQVLIEGQRYFVGIQQTSDNPTDTVWCNWAPTFIAPGPIAADWQWATIASQNLTTNDPIAAAAQSGTFCARFIYSF